VKPALRMVTLVLVVAGCSAAGGAIATGDESTPSLQGWTSPRENSPTQITRERLVDPSASESGTSILPEAGSREWLKALESARHVRESMGERTDNCPHQFDVLHYDIAVSIDFAGQQIYGDTHVRSVSEIGGLQQIDLDLTVLTVDAVLSSGSPVSYVYQDPVLSIDLGQSYAAGDTFEVEVVYHGHPGNEGTGGFGGFYFGANPPIAYHMAVGLWAQPPSMGKYWFPCWDWPCDKATADYHITVPDEMIAVCNGRLVGSARHGETRTTTYNWTEPSQISPHVMSVAACAYTELVDDTYSWIHYWVYPQQVANARIHFSNVHTMMDGFISRFGPYPFAGEKFGYAAAPKGDMEHQTCVTHLSGLILPNHTYDWILAHEMCHQWWGDCVAINDWRDVWLSEGFATYGEAIFQEYAYGAAAYRNYMITQLMNPVFNSSENFPIYDPDYLWGTTVYEKGGTVLHMLRHVVGDTRFFQALAVYRAAHEHQNAVTPQFQSAVESVHGASLNWFFQEWIYDRGWPEYQYYWSDREVAGVHHVDLFIGQFQTNGPTFRMPVDVKITTTTGDSLFVLWVNQRQQWFDLTVNGTPTAVAFDPDSWILCRKQPVNVSTDGAAGQTAPNTASLEAIPNPFRQSTTLRFRSPAGEPIRVEIFSPAGQRVRVLSTGAGSGGPCAIPWDGRDERGLSLPSGTYFCRVKDGDICQTKRITMLR
jgi:aminopeptidase N